MPWNVTNFDSNGKIKDSRVYLRTASGGITMGGATASGSALKSSALLAYGAASMSQPTASGVSAISVPATGLLFPENEATGSDIRLVWDGTNFLPRKTHTVLVRTQYFQQTGFYAMCWHSYNNGIWYNGSDGYAFGMHPYPCDGDYNAGGESTYSEGDAGTVHYGSMAGASGDKIALPDGPYLVVKDGRWLTQAKVAWVTGSVVTQRVYWDIDNYPDEYIEDTFTTTELADPGGQGFYFGSSDWQADYPTAGKNNECPGCVLRGIRMFDEALSIADIITEAAAIGNDTPATSAGAASVWYINDNPTPTDVTDKSSAGHDPYWDNANRPTLWEA